MTEQGQHNWQNLEPPLDQLDQQLRQALQGPEPPADLADRIFEATADQAMDRDLTAALRGALAAEPPADLADRIAAAAPLPQTQPQTQHDGHRSILATIGRFAAAAVVTLAVGLTLYLGSGDSSEPADTTSPVADGSTAVAPVQDDPFDALEWAFVGEDSVRQEMSALASDLAALDQLTAVESEAAIEEELTRQHYYYELADAQAASF